MKPYKQIHKCLSADCNKNVEERHTFCEDCMKKRKELGNWMQKQEKTILLQVNNPKGNNQHTPKEKLLPKRKILNEMERFERLTDQQQRELIGTLGNELYRIKREIRPKLLAFNKYKEYYEAKHFGWKTED